MNSINRLAAAILLVWRCLATAETNEVVVFTQAVGTNTVTLTYTKVRGETQGKEQADRAGFVFVGTRDFWRYRLYLGANVNQQSKIIWERSFKDAQATKTPREVGLLAYYIDPQLDCVVIVSRNSQTAFGDVCSRINGGYTNLVSEASSYLVPKADAFQGRLLASAKVSPSTKRGTFDVRITTEDGLGADFVFTGSRWRTKLRDESAGRRGTADEVVVFEDVAGSNRVVGTYVRIGEDVGLRLAAKALEGRGLTGSPVPYDRRYCLKLKSLDPSKEMVLWEKCFTCDRFEDGLFAAPTNARTADRNSNIVRTHFDDSAVNILGYYIDGALGRTVVFYTYINRIYGEVFESGKNGATNLSGIAPFYMSIPGRATAAVMVSPRGIPETYYATVTVGSGGKTNILFDGKRWIPDPTKPQ